MSLRFTGLLLVVLGLQFLHLWSCKTSVTTPLNVCGAANYQAKSSLFVVKRLSCVFTFVELVAWKMAEFDFVQVGAAAPADGGYDSQICCHQTTSDIHHFEFYKFYTDTATCK